MWRRSPCEDRAPPFPTPSRCAAHATDDIASSLLNEGLIIYFKVTIIVLTKYIQLVDLSTNPVESKLTLIVSSLSAIFRVALRI